MNNNKKNKLFWENEWITNKKFLVVVCIVITFLMLFLINLFCRTLSHLGDIIRGTFSSYLLIVPSLKFLPFYFLALIVSAIFCILLLSQIQTNFGNINVGQKGKRRFLTTQEIKQIFLEIDDKNTPFDGQGGMPVSRIGNKLYIDPVPTNNFILAGTRSGKTETLAIATIDILSRANTQTSMIITDVKGTMANACIPHLYKRGYDIYILDTINFGFSDFYNVMHLMVSSYKNGDHSTTERLCHHLTSIMIPEEVSSSGKFWQTAPSSFLTAVILAMIEDCVKEDSIEKITPYNVFVFISVLGTSSMQDSENKSNNRKSMSEIDEDKEREITSRMDNYFLSRPPNNPARLAYTSITFSQGKTRSILASVLITSIDLFRQPGIAEITSKNTIPLQDIGFGNKPVAIFLRVPFHVNAYNQLISIFISQAYYINMDIAIKTNYNKLKRPVKVIGDEIFNSAVIPELDTAVSAGLGSLWSFDFYAQSYAQPENRYGEKIAKIIMDNCSTTYFLGSPNLDVREKVSKEIGNKTILNVSRSGTRFGLGKTITEQYESHPLIHPDDLAELQEGEVIVIPSLKRKNLKGDLISPMPIFNTGETRMTYRYQYMPEWRDDEPIPYELIGKGYNGTNEFDLQKNLFLPDEFNEKKNTQYPQNLNVTANNTALVAHVLSPTTLNNISHFLPQNMILDFDAMTIDNFIETINSLQSHGHIKKSDYNSIMNLVNNKISQKGIKKQYEQFD